MGAPVAGNFRYEMTKRAPSSTQSSKLSENRRDRGLHSNARRRDHPKDAGGIVVR
jgi:hypothetical protein